MFLRHFNDTIRFLPKIYYLLAFSQSKHLRMDGLYDIKFFILIYTEKSFQVQSGRH